MGTDDIRFRPESEREQMDLDHAAETIALLSKFLSRGCDPEITGDDGPGGWWIYLKGMKDAQGERTPTFGGTLYEAAQDANRYLEKCDREWGELHGH